ncbi:MmgE/PrpD family protein [Paraburkholderia sp. BL10I2N1]|uniref:MmgE/PrpD family protein n=1 Tax=Paraburkholderia sp. BL10I2N1 TaxID=1938796 RepID=UPI0010D79E2C|nr:MmgE/PrpD family protein [Paraburkholderia sp. BL10I2N1]TDN63087.1 MmgE/PrpD family protein [Paraburkholderia sp. BL10I2N1]
MNYCGIDLHSNNSMVTVIDETDRIVAERRLPNDLTKILDFLAPWKEGLAGVVVESTFNWYWLVDGLQATGFHPLEAALLKDAVVLKLARKVKMRRCADYMSAFPRSTPSRVRVRQADRWYEHEITSPVGDVGNAMSWQQTEEKYRDLTSRASSSTRAQTERVIHACVALAFDLDRPANEFIRELR